jgi:hypothetical protein
MVTYLDDDAGFIEWRDSHPRGFIVNHDRVPAARYLKVHHATCWTLEGALPRHGGNWTTAYAKRCDRDLDALRRWARSIGGELQACAFCSP